MATGALIAGGIGAAASLIGGSKQREQEAEAMKQYQAQIAAAVAELEKVGIPSIEAQKIIVQSPELVGLESIPENLRSEFGMIETNPELKELQYKNLAQQQEIADEGMTAQDKLQREMTGRSVSADYQARQKAALSQLAQQGRRSGGAELIMQQQANQDSSNRAQMEALQQQAAKEAGRRDAIRGVAQTAGNLRGQEHGEAAQKASAIDRFNVGNRDARMSVGARNLDRQQTNENQRVGAANQQEAHNKGLIGKDYENRLAKAKSLSSARTGGAQTAYGGAMKSASDTGSMWGGIGQAAIGLGSSLYAGRDKGADSVVASGGGGGSPNYMAMQADGGLNNKEDGKKLIKELYYADGGNFMSDGTGEIVDSGEESYEGDRVDAKLNDKELVINAQQQQRLLELLQGYRDLKDIGDENIVENPENGEAPMPMEGDTPPINGGQEMPMNKQDEINQMADGGMLTQQTGFYADGGTSDDKYARGISEEYDKACKHAEEMKEAQGATKKKINAMEELLGIKDRKKKDQEAAKNKRY